MGIKTNRNRVNILYYSVIVQWAESITYLTVTHVWCICIYTIYNRQTKYDFQYFIGFSRFVARVKYTRMKMIYFNSFFFSFRFIYNKTKKYEHFYYYTLCAACRNTYVQYRFRVVRIVVTLEMYKSIVSPRDYCGGSKKKTISKKYGFIEILHCKMSFRLSPVKYNK